MCKHYIGQYVDV